MCLRKCEGKNCDKDTGDCTEGCKDLSKYENQCTKLCQETCNENKCHQNGSCVAWRVKVDFSANAVTTLVQTPVDIL